MLKVEPEGPVLRVTLNRPEVRNAFNDELIAALQKSVRQRSFDRRPRREYVLHYLHEHPP